MPLDAVLASQYAWARTRWPGHTGRRAPSLPENLIVPMSSEVREQFRNGSGGELGNCAKPGKMSSLRSSSALAFNFFAPWLGNDLRPLAAALGQEINDCTLGFERKFPHGLSSTPPNMDVTFDNEQVRPLAVECKFTEPYGSKKGHHPLDLKYFDGGRARWSEQGLPKCQRLAESIGQNIEFKRLGVGQLLKHILGLAWTTKRAPRLVCIWYDTRCEEAHEHRAELERFRAHLDDVVEFSALSYQEVFTRLRNGPEPVPRYAEYLVSRYFAA
jgi:hypothetical protein